MKEVEKEEPRLSCFDAIFLCGVFLSRTSKCSRLVPLIIAFRMSRQWASEDLWSKSWSCFPILFLFEWWLPRFMRKFYSPSLVFAIEMLLKRVEVPESLLMDDMQRIYSTIMFLMKETSVFLQEMCIFHWEAILFYFWRRYPFLLSLLRSNGRIKWNYIHLPGRVVIYGEEGIWEGKGQLLQFWELESFFNYCFFFFHF